MILIGLLHDKRNGEIEMAKAPELEKENLEAHVDPAPTL